MRWLLILMLLGVALRTGAAEPNEAEKLFREMEKKVADAKMLTCEFEATVSKGTEPVWGSFKGTFVVGEGSRCRLEIRDIKIREINDMKNELAILSDGTKAQVLVNGRIAETMAAPKQLRAMTVASITRAGFFAQPILHSKNAKDDVKIDEQFAVSDFKLGKKEKVGEIEAQEVQYILKTKELEATTHVSVWLDTKTNLPVKRVMVSESSEGVDPVAFKSTISKLILDAKVDSKTFELK